VEQGRHEHIVVVGVDADVREHGDGMALVSKLHAIEELPLRLCQEAASEGKLPGVQSRAEGMKDLA
jgi:hypothetical protein